MGIRGDLQELFDKFPTPAGEDFMLQIPYYSPGMRWGNAKLRSNCGLKYGREDCSEFSFGPFKAVIAHTEEEIDTIIRMGVFCADKTCLLRPNHIIIIIYDFPCQK